MPMDATLVLEAASPEEALEAAAAIPGILGVLLIKDGQIGMQGSRLPELVKNEDVHTREKITVDRRAHL